MAKSDLPAAHHLLCQSYSKFQLAMQIKSSGYDALSNWAAALMVEHKALLNSEPIEAAKVLLEAKPAVASSNPDARNFGLQPGVYLRA